ARCQALSVSAPAGRPPGGGGTVAMAQFVLKYADGRGQIHQQVATAGSEKELRDRYSQQGFLIYSIKPRLVAAPKLLGRPKKLNLAVRKKVLVSLLYPAVLVVLVILLMVFLVTYVVPTFAALYSTMQAQLPSMTLMLIAVGTTARSYILVFAGALLAAIFLVRWWARRES